MATPKFNLPEINKENSKMSFKNLVGKKMSKSVKFMGEDTNISKLSVSQILLVQEAAKIAEADDTQSFEILKTIIRASADGATDVTDEEFSGFPVDELSTLANQIMVFSGIDAGKK